MSHSPPEGSRVAVAGGGGFLGGVVVDERKPNVVFHLDEVLGSAARRRDLGERGMRRVGARTWARSARKLANAYREVLA